MIICIEQGGQSRSCRSCRAVPVAIDSDTNIRFPHPVTKITGFLFVSHLL